MSKLSGERDVSETAANLENDTEKRERASNRGAKIRGLGERGGEMEQSEFYE